MLHSHVWPESLICLHVICSSLVRPSHQMFMIAEPSFYAAAEIWLVFIMIRVERVTLLWKIGKMKIQTSVDCTKNVSFFSRVSMHCRISFNFFFSKYNFIGYFYLHYVLVHLLNDWYSVFILVKNFTCRILTFCMFYVFSSLQNLFFCLRLRGAAYFIAKKL